MGEVLVIGKK